jgi:hypothetical protein
MKEVLSLITVGIWALFFVVFFAALKPDVVNVATGPSKPGYCDTKASSTLACRSLIFAAAMWSEVRPR